MEMLGTFDGSTPNLISSRTLKDIETKLNVPDTVDNGNRVFNGIGHFYNEYILPNLFALIVVSLLIIYLAIRYILKRDREEKGEEKNEEKDEEDEDISEKEERQHRTKKHMVKIDPDTINDKEVQPDISDIISDDYLLTDDDEEDEEDLMRQAMDSGSPYDIEKATKVVFAEL